MKIYVTKYLFTEEIQEMEAETIRDRDACVSGSGPSFFNGQAWYYSNDWHSTREAAVAHAEVMRTRKIAALDKQRKKIAEMVIA